MKLLRIIIVLFVLFCSCKKDQEQKDELVFWEIIQKAVKGKDLNYLVKISQDTLSCMTCNNGKNWIEKNEFFKNHLDQMQVPKNKNYSYFVEEVKSKGVFKKRYRINYKYEKSNVIYTVLEGKGNVKFQGVFSVP